MMTSRHDRSDAGEEAAIRRARSVLGKQPQDNPLAGGKQVIGDPDIWIAGYVGQRRLATWLMALPLVMVLTAVWARSESSWAVVAVLAAVLTWGAIVFEVICLAFIAWDTVAIFRLHRVKR